MRPIRRHRFRKPKVYAFIDSQNLNLGVQKAGWKMDWRKFREYLRKEHNVTQAYMFIGYMQEHEALYEQMHDTGYAVVLKPTVDIARPQEESHSGLSGVQGEADKRSKSYKKYGERVSEASTQGPPSREDSSWGKAQNAAKSAAGISGSADEQGGTARVTKGNVDADLVLYAMKEMPNYDKAIIVSGDGDFYGLIEYLIQQKKLQHVMTPNWQYSSLLKQFESYIIRLDQQRNTLRYFDRRKKPKK